MCIVCIVCSFLFLLVYAFMGVLVHRNAILLAIVHVLKYVLVLVYFSVTVPVPFDPESLPSTI